MDIKNEMEQITNKIIGLNHYDKEGFVLQLRYHVDQLHFFYNILVPKQTPKDGVASPSRTYFSPRPRRPREGEIAYFNLTRGFPKEIYDGHYCYILQDFKTQVIIIPTTSVKEDSRSPNEDVEFDISLEGFLNDKATRFHVDAIRAIDIQRVNPLKSFFNPIASRDDILKNIFIRLGFFTTIGKMYLKDIDKSGKED